MRVRSAKRHSGRKLVDVLQRFQLRPDDGNTLPLIAAEQLAAIIESASEAIVGKRLDGIVTSWNPAAEQLFGYPLAEIIGRSITVLLPEDRLNEEADIIARLQAGERIPPFETVRRRKDGALIDVEVSIAPIRDRTGSVIGASKIARDIRKLVASRLSERRLTRFMHALTEASRATSRPTSDQELFAEMCRICVDPGGATSCWLIEGDGDTPNLKACAGLSEASALSITTQLFSSPDARCALARGESVVITGVTGWLAAEPNDCATASVTVAGLPFKRNGAVSGTLAVMSSESDFFDASAMDLMRELASDLSNTLTSRARDLEFQGIVESAMDAIIAVDANHRILRFNQSASDLFLWPRHEAVGQPIERIIPDRFRAKQGELMDRFAANESMPRRMGAARRLMGLRSDGTEVPIEATVSRFGSGAGLRMIVVIRDASSLRLAETALRAQREAEAANRAKTDFLSHMSHELRTPLNAVLGFAQVMSSDPQFPTTGRQRTQLRHIQAAGRHLHALISDLLDMARIEAGLLSVQHTVVSLEDALQDVFDLVAPMAEAAAVDVIPPDDRSLRALVHADPTRLRQVLSNLISNATKYNRQGGSVRVETQTLGDRVRIRVIDSGLGMTDQQLSRLFEPYNRLGREKSAVSGTGIGLVVTKKLVELMGGTLEIRSEVDAGTCAEVTLPAAVGDATAARAAVTAPGQLHAADVAGVVLSVEDNEVNQILLESLFLRWPRIRLVQAVDGASGLEMARNEHPDLVLLDMNLPDMNGLQFMQAVSADPRLESLKVIALSASAMPEEVESALSSGIVDYMTKPLDVEQFTRKLFAFLGASLPGPGGLDG